MTQVKAACPRCGATYRVEPEQVGREATCRQCAQVFVVRETDGTGSSIAQLGSRTVVQRAPMAVPPSVGPNALVAASESLSQPEVVMLSSEPAPSMATPPPPHIEPHPTPASSPSVSGAAPHQDTPRPPTNLGPVPGGGEGAKGIDSKSTPVTPPSDKLAPPAAPPPAPGKSSTLGRFEILEELGEGAFGTVYKARDTYLDRPVALKIPRFGVLTSEADAQRFLREARAAGNLRHPNIVPIYDAGKIGNTYYIAAGFIEGRTLADRLEAEEKLNRREAAVLIQKLALALHYAHSKGIVHRDMKPANVMLDTDGEPLVMDFGTARREEGDMLRTQEGMHMGTPAYMSPEQHAGQSHLADARSDQWALGVMLYEMLTGERPFQGPTTIQMSYAVRETEPEKPSKLNHKIPKDLETICLKCLQKDPEKRYPTCQHLAEDVDHCLRGEPITARPVWPVERFVRWCRRNPVAAILASVTAATMCLATVTSISFALYAHRQAETAFREKLRADESVAVALREQVRADGSVAIAIREAANSQRNVYYAQIALAHKRCCAGDVNGAWNVLDVCPVEHRGWEWGYLKRRSQLDTSTERRDTTDAVSVTTTLGRRPQTGASDEKTAESGDLQSSDGAITLPGGAGRIFSVRFSPDGRRLASAGEDTTVRIWDTESGQQVLGLHHDKNNPPWYYYAVHCAEFSPDGKHLATADYHATRIWDISTGKIIHRIFGRSYSLAFSPDARQLAVGGDHGKVRIWNTETGWEMPILDGISGEVRGVRFSPDGKRVLAANASTGTRIWDIETHDFVILPGHASFTWLRGALTGCECRGKTLRLWNVQTGRELINLRGHEWTVGSFAWSPDGKRLASAGDGNTVKIWDAETGYEILSLDGHNESFKKVEFSPDGRRLASASENGTVKIWEAVDWRVSADGGAK